MKWLSFLLFPSFLLAIDFAFLDTVEGEVSWQSGYRCDGFNWNIAAPSGTPNVLSELSWKKIKCWENALVSRFYFCDHFALKFEGAYGKIVSGTNTDKDWGADNRQNLFSLSTNDAGKGEVFDIFIGGGYRFPFGLCDSCWSVTPYVGYAQQEQHYRQYNGFQTFYNGLNNPFLPIDIDFSGPIEGLHSNYRSRFKGYFAGLDVEGKMGCFTLRLSGDILWNHFQGIGHWNLRDDFANDFIQKGRGHGQRIVLEAAYDVTRCLQLGIFAKYTQMRVKNGTDHTFFFIDDGDPIPPGGEVPIIEGVTRLNQVRWHSVSLGLSLTYIY